MKRISCFILASAIILIACNNSDNTANVDIFSPAVHGVVVDENGKPVADAEVCVIPDLPGLRYIIGSSDPYKNKNSKIQVAELSNFDVMLYDTYAEITWTTDSELNTSKFILEKSINQTGIFKPFDSVKALGKSNIPIKYRRVDNNIQKNIHYYYRLKIIDLDDSYQYSDSRSVKIYDYKTTILGNSPNPIKTATTVSFSAGKDFNGSFEITEKSTGESFCKISDTFKAGQYAINWYTKNILSPDTNQALRPGVYVATLKTTDTVISHNMIYAFTFDTTNCIIPLEVTKTDKFGKFVIPYNYFPDYQEAYRIDEAGRTLGKFNYGISANIVVRKTVESNPTQNVYLLSQNRLLVDKSKSVNLDCKMQRLVVKK